MVFMNLEPKEFQIRCGYNGKEFVETVTARSVFGAREQVRCRISLRALEEAKETFWVAKLQTTIILE